MENGILHVENLVRRFHAELDPQYGQPEVSQFVAMLADHYLGWDKARLHAGYQTQLTPASVSCFMDALDGLKLGRPIQYIIGTVRFGDLELEVNPSVLIPRPETEELCSIIAAENPHFRFRDVSCLDIGTGSGCIAISLKKSFSYWSVTGIDISAEAAETARRNAERNNCDIRVEVSDITREASWSVLGRFDLVVSNPPYVTELEKSRMQPNVLHHEPAVALFVADHDPLLFYRTIADFCNRQMTRPGLLYLEINERFGKEVRDLLHEKGFTKARIIRDFHGKERFVSAEVTEPLHDTSYWYADKPG